MSQLIVNGVAAEYGGRTIFENVTFTARVTRGEVVGLIGPNGSGKSTLLRAIAGERGIERGALRVGASIRPAFYRQDLAQVPSEKTLFATIHDLRPLWDRGQVQNHLGRFGFSGEEVERRAGTLSGGEQARVALAMMVLSGANLLLFDEPINHLDVESIEALEDAIEAFDGTVILVSHDRALLRALTSRVWSLRGMTIEDYHGPFGEWEVVQEERARADAETAARADAERREQERRRTKRTQQSERDVRADRRSGQAEVAEAETRVHALEAEVARLETALQDPSLYGTPEGVSRSVARNAELAAAREALESALSGWMELVER